MALGELPPTLITAGDIYAEVLRARSDTANILQRIAVIEYRNQGDDSVAQDHEKRLRTLERFKWQLLGAVLATSALSGLVTGLILAHI